MVDLTDALMKAQGDIAKQAEVRDFDLNVEQVLDSWSVSHAVREIIANALDEQTLTQTAPIEIVRVKAGRWTIRDYGSGLNHTHLTQNENPEKRRRESEVIGRFGVGLKDALAVLDRHNVNVTVCSAHGDISLVHRSKVGFSDVRTLHARVSPPSNPGMSGTEVNFIGLEDKAVEEAKLLFLAFSGEDVLERTKFGQILRRRNLRPARIYVKGLLVAEEPNFAFSYNVTALTQPMRKALNRERTNVGRMAYSERVKAMLLAAESTEVVEILASDLEDLATGTSHDEVRSWSDVGLRACQILNAKRSVVFVTAEELLNHKEMVDRAVEDRREVITVPSAVAEKLGSVTDFGGNALQSLSQFADEWSASIAYQFLGAEELTLAEFAIFDRWREIAALAGELPEEFIELKVSESMRPSVAEGMDPDGLWEEDSGRIIVHRRVLRSLDKFAGTLLHELAHASSGYDDVSRDFESELTDLLGTLAVRALS